MPFPYSVTYSSSTLPSLPLSYGQSHSAAPIPIPQTHVVPTVKLSYGIKEEPHQHQQQQQQVVHTSTPTLTPNAATMPLKSLVDSFPSIPV